MLCNCEVVRHSDSKHMELLTAHNSWSKRWVVMLSSSLGISKDNLTGLYTVKCEIIFFCQRLYIAKFGRSRCMYRLRVCKDSCLKS